jgi:acetolactate synthase-1/2/3 large subunit
MRFGDYLVALLERHGVTHVFGIPGVHTAELYRGLAGARIRHVTPRHEQGAGFMADGYARISGKPGVCFVITGPGLTNIATAMAQARQDSIPMLVISGVAATSDLGQRKGMLHELPDQQGLASKLAEGSHSLRRAEDLGGMLAEAFDRFGSRRRRPMHIEVPLDLMAQDVSVSLPEPTLHAQAETPDALRDAAALLVKAERPLILLGGGARNGSRHLAPLAELLDAPAIMTVNGRDLLPFGHALSVPASPSLEAVRELIRDSDVVLAIGTELGQTDYDMYARGGFDIPGELIRIDIDRTVSGLLPPKGILLHGDSEQVLGALLPLIEPSGNRSGKERARAAREAAFQELSPTMQRQVEFLNMVRDTLPNAVIVGDSTKPVYAGNLFFEAGQDLRWFNSATGYGTLGYALPAAIGAKLAAPARPVVCIAGDGGIQFTLGELGSAIDAGTPIIVLVWNNHGYGEIRSYFEEKGIAIGVDVTAPDFVAVARAYGWAAERLADRSSLPDLLRAASGRAVPTLIDIDERIGEGR